jgi:hypothetical protein
LLRVNPSINLCVRGPSGNGKVEMKLAREHDGQLCIEQRLNIVGRGILMATTRESWVNTLQDLNTL